MAAFSASDVQALRQATGAGMMDCKRALQESDGDSEKAKAWLREMGLAGAAKRSDRTASQGAVALAVEGGAASIVLLRCETDFVAKADNFVSLVDELAQLVASKGEAAANEREAAVEELQTTLKENISVGTVLRWDLVPESSIGTYLHVQDGRGVNAVLVEMEGGSDQLAHDVAVHIAFGKPTALTREDISAEDVANEHETVEKISRNEGKPEAALPKIIEGRMNGWYKEQVLLEQPYAKDDKLTVKDFVGSAKILRFAQVVVGV